MLYRYHNAKGKDIKQGRGPAHLGLEIEFVARREAFSSHLAMAGYIEKTLLESGFHSRLFTFEHDSSLAGHNILGVEVIFRPMSWKVFSRLSWDTWMDRLRRENRLILGHPSAGMHVHLDRLTSRSPKPAPDAYFQHVRVMWHALLCLKDRERLRLFGRESNGYCVGDSELEMDEEQDVYCGTDSYGDSIYETEHTTRRYRVIPEEAYHGDADFLQWAGDTRYVPLNATGETTLEIRVFASPSNGQQVLGAGEFALRAAGPAAYLEFLTPENAEQVCQEGYDVEVVLSDCRLVRLGWYNV